MSEIEPPLPDSPVLWDAPNQQVVRADESAPWEEGGGGGTEVEPPAGTATVDQLETMTKAELLDYARSIGASPANNDMSKDELRASIVAAGG